MKENCERNDLTLWCPDAMTCILVQALQSGDENLAMDIIKRRSDISGDKQLNMTMDLALFFCCCRGYLDLAKLLIDKGANVGFRDKNSATPLHGAVDNGHLNVVRLLTIHGANLNARTCRGDTPLHLAAYRGFWNITHWLIKAGADCRLLNGSSLMPETEAMGHGFHELGSYLRSVRCALYPDRADGADQQFDSMIQLDPPSAFMTNAPVKVHKKEDDHYKIRTDVQKDLDPRLNQRIKLHKTNDNYQKTTLNKCNISEFDDLSIILLDPPENVLSPVSRQSYENQPFYKTINALLNLPSSTSNNDSLQQIDKSVNSSFSPSVSPPVLSTAVDPLCRTALSLTDESSSHMSTEQCLSSFSIRTDDRRTHTSTESECSSFCDIYECLECNTESLISWKSDVSECLSDEKSQDRQLCERDKCDEDILFQSFGVRNPPIKKPIARFQQMSYSAEFSDIYDSTLYSLSSVAAVPSSLSKNKPLSDKSNYISQQSSRNPALDIRHSQVYRTQSDGNPTVNIKPKLWLNKEINLLTQTNANYIQNKASGNEINSSSCNDATL